MSWTITRIARLIDGGHRPGMEQVYSKFDLGAALPILAILLLAVPCLAAGIPPLTSAHCPDGDPPPDFDHQLMSIPEVPAAGASGGRAAAEASYFLQVSTRKISAEFTRIDSSRGSAVAIDQTTDSCILLTSKHVIDDAIEINVMPWRPVYIRGTSVPNRLAKVIWANAEVDAALLAAPLDDGCRLVIGEREYPAVGEEIITFGHPFDQHGLLAGGRVDGYWSVNDLGMLLVSHIPVDPGASGAGVFTRDGALVGIVFGTTASATTASPDVRDDPTVAYGKSFVMPICRILAKLPFSLKERDALIAAARSAYKAKKWGVLLARATALFAIDPKSVDALADIALAYINTNNPDFAIAKVDMAIALAPDKPELYHYKSLALAQKGQGEEASTLDRQACQLGMKDICRKPSGPKSSSLRK